MINGEMVREFAVGFQFSIEPGRLFSAGRRQVSGIEEVDDKIPSEFARVITAVLFLGEVTEIKSRAGGRTANSTSDLMISNRQDHGDCETPGSHHALLPAIKPGVPQPIIGRQV